MSFLAMDIHNPFGAPVFRRTVSESTMKDARTLAGEGYPDGTVTVADFQSAGRGRIDGRSWDSPAGENLLCTVLFRRSAPRGFTLRVGLAVARTFDAFLGQDTASKTSIKWPNDILFAGKKLSGILCENDGTVLYTGTGFNLGQRDFPPELSAKASSLSLILPPGMELPSRATVLERYLAELESALSSNDWQTGVSEKLLWRGERISFLAGDPRAKELVDGVIEGIGPEGELLFRSAANVAVPGGTAFKPDPDGLIHLWSGEIPYPGN